MTSIQSSKNDSHAFHYNNVVVKRLRKRVQAMLLLRKLNPVKKIMLPTYSHISECERDVLNTSVVQSEDQQSFQLGKVLESPQFYIFECTLDLFKILTTPGVFSKPGLLISILSLFIKAITGKTTSSQIMWIVEKFKDIFNTVQSEEVSENSESSNPFAKIREYFTNWEKFKTHPLVKKLVSIFHYILGTSLLLRFGISYEKCFFSKAEAEASRRTHNSSFGMLGSICDGVLYIMERLFDVHRTGSWQPILHTGTEYSKWIDEVYALKEMSQKLQNPDLFDIQIHEFVSRMDSALEKGEAIIKYSVDLDASAKTSAKKFLSDLRLLKCSYMTKSAARRTRDAPFAVLLFGGSSIGKTTISNAIETFFAKVHDLPLGDDFTYTRCFSDKHWSGFSTSMWAIRLDDIGARNPNLGDDMSLDEVLQIINFVSFCPPQADIDDKGKTPVCPKLVTATTNVKNLNAGVYYCSELAIRRRLPYVITPSVKSEYAVEVNGIIPPVPFDRMLDSSKTYLCTDPIPNYWEFKVEKIVARPVEHENVPQGCELRMIMHDVDIFELFRFLGRVSMEHTRNQVIVRESKRDLENMQICKGCYTLVENCTCEVQSSEIVNYVAPAMPYALTAGLTLGCYHYAPKIQEYITQCIVDCGKRMAYNFMKKKATNLIAPIAGVKIFSKKFVKQQVCKLEEVQKKLIEVGVTASERLSMEQTMMKEFFYEQGEKARLAGVTGNKMLLAAVTAIPLMIGIYKLYNSWNNLGIQGSSVSGGILTTQDEKPNPWFRDEYEPSSFDVGRLAASWKALPFNDVVDRIAKNVFFAKFNYINDKGMAVHRPGRILCLGGHLCVTTSHNICDYADIQAEIISMPIGDGINGNFVIKLVQRDLLRIPNSELVFFRLNNMPPKSNLIDCIPGESFRTVCNGTKIFRNELGQITKMPVKGIQHVMQSISDPKVTGTFSTWKCVGTYNTVKGDCGAPLVGNTPQGPHILGLHILGGSNNLSQSVQISRTQVDLALLHFGEPMVQSGAPYLCDPQDKPVLLDPIHYKAPVRFIEEGVGYAYGSFPGWRPSHSSKVMKTHICDEMVERGYQIKTDKPVMSGYKPWHLATTDIVQQTFQAEQSVIDDCVQAYASDILSELNAEDLAEMIILSDLATVNGIPGVKYVDKMNRNTSMGWPYNKKKKFFMTEPHQEEIWNDAVDFDDSFYNRVNRIISKYETGQRYMPVFMAHLKDEPTKFSKIESGATRVFLGAPADWSFVMRKYLLTFVRVLQNNKYTFEAAPGTNATSMEWEEMYRYLTYFGKDRMIAGDFSKFDKRMSAQWILAAFKVIDIIITKAGWSEKDRCIVSCIGADTAFPLCNMNGDLVEFWGSNPSGHPLTVIINSMVNAMYMRYAWVKGGNILSLFKKQVHLITYGDDNTMGVSQLAKNFDHTIIQAEMEKIGVKYTMADKESVSIPFININQISFLKRAWRWESELNAHVAQLEEDSIAKMLTKCLPSKVVCPERQAVDLIYNALGEYFYYGRTVFEEKRSMFLEVIAKKGLQPYVVRDFPDFDNMIIDYKEASRDIRFKW